MSEQIYIEKSKIHTSGRYTILAFMAVILFWFIYTVYRSITQNIFLLPDFAIQGMILFVLIKQGFSKYEYIIENSKLVIKEYLPWGNKTYHIPYADLDGICEYKRDLFGKLKYRYKYRLASAMDARIAKQLIYSFVENGKIKHARIIIKADDAFYDELKRILPDKILISQDDLIFNALVREQAFLQGCDYEEFLKMAKAEQDREQKGK